LQDEVPVVKLKIINEALPGDTPDYHKKYNNNKNPFLSIKVRTYFQVSMHLRVFLVADRLRLRRTRDI
jgi:hypothetical protein